MYIIFPILAVAIISYLISFFMAKKKVFSLRTHLKMWNSLLVLSFLITAILGIMLVIRINYGFFLRIPFNMTFWHVEFGITMAILTIFHILWYTPFLRKISNALKKKKD